MINKMSIKNKKIKKGSNGMEPRNLLTPSSGNYNRKKYLNFLVRHINSYAGMAEWSTQLVNTECPFGFVGSIPTSSVTQFKLSWSFE